LSKPADASGMVEVAMTPQIRVADIPRLFSEGIEDDVAPKSRRQRRAELLAESVRERYRRRAHAMVDAIAGMRWANLWPIVDIVAHDYLVKPEGLPDPQRALADPDGFCGIADDLRPATLLAAQSRGLFPCAPLGPIAWWAPAQRFAAHPARIASSLALEDPATERDLELSFDRDFEQVLVQSAGERSGLTPRLMHAFADLFDAGSAHSFTLHARGGRLLGGGFGVATGRCFVTQHCFSLVPGAAKAALRLVSRQLAAWDFAVHDIRPAAASGLGLEPLPRDEHALLLAGHRGGGRPGLWIAEPPALAA
jgi:leucyl/phenylalanyl-tRNA--protein transferase